MTLPRPAPMPHHASGKRQDRGTATVELALILPVLATLAAFAFQFGQIYRLQNALQRTALSGARAMSLSPPAQFGSQLAGITAQMLQDLQAAGISGISAGNIQLQCLDVTLSAFATAPAYCLPGASAPADSSLGFVQAVVTLPQTSGLAFPFFFPSGNGTGKTFTGPSTLMASAIYRYAPQ
ncbi:MAG: pilus assembly protein [Betaproteobacteria bacterium]|nr:pilus assembly protein [Betaproteobacteria bacterium]MDE2623117.1 pilus assembly protein [Betaproteobacteria bacterium]